MLPFFLTTCSLFIPSFVVNRNKRGVRFSSCKTRPKCITHFLYFNDHFSTVYYHMTLNKQNNNCFTLLYVYMYIRTCSVHAYVHTLYMQRTCTCTYMRTCTCTYIAYVMYIHCIHAHVHAYIAYVAYMYIYVIIVQHVRIHVHV